MTLPRWLNWRVGRTGPEEFAGLFAVGLFMAAIGAFDTEHTPLVPRYLYWLTVMLGGGIIAALIEPWLWRVPRLAAAPVLLAAVQVLAMTPPIALLVWLVGSLGFGRAPDPGVLPVLAPGVLVVDVGVVILAVLVRRALRPLRSAPERVPASQQVAPPPIREKLPPRLARAELIAVQAEDHYLRIHTSAGNQLILMRFADALEALQGSDGLQVHRSWWVARRAVDLARFSRGRGELALKGGLTAPVSRTFAPQLKQVDWA